MTDRELLELAAKAAGIAIKCVIGDTFWTPDDDPSTYPAPIHGWCCFHCGENFTKAGSARDHFGGSINSLAACRIKAGGEKGLLMALRKAEEDLATVRGHLLEEDTAALRELAREQSRHSDALRTAEEAGYERGLKDYTVVETERNEAEKRAAENGRLAMARLNEGLTYYHERNAARAARDKLLEALVQASRGSTPRSRHHWQQLCDSVIASIKGEVG